MALSPLRRATTAAAVAASLVMGGCRDRPGPAAQTAASAAHPAAPTAPVATPAPLGRADLLRAVAEASDAVAAGRPVASDDLADRRFQLRLPFGCEGQDASTSAVRAVVDDNAGTLRLAAGVQDWSKAPWALALAGGEDVEAIEGFWIRRPWLLSEACPARPAAPGPFVSPETLGVAQIFRTGDSRVTRRGGRPYAVTRKLAEGEAPGAFRLVLEGRLAARDKNGGPVRCLSDHPDRRPTCLVLVVFDRVAFEDAKGEVLAEWRS